MNVKFLKRISNTPKDHQSNVEKYSFLLFVFLCASATICHGWKCEVKGLIAYKL